MPLKDAPSSQGTKARIATFTAACSPLWGNATRLVVRRKASPKKTLRDPEIVLLKDAEGAVVDESQSCIDELMRAIEVDVEKNSPGEYEIALIGIAELPIKGRKKTTGQPQIELKASGWIRFGDEDAEIDDTGASDVRGILRETGKMITNVSGAVGNIAAASNIATTGMESVVGVQTRVIEAQAAAFASVSLMENKGNETMIAVKTLEIGHEQWKFDQEQKERRYQEEREERQKLAAEEQAQKREFMEKGLAALLGLANTVAEDRKQARTDRREAEARARGETPPVDTTAEPTTPPAANTIAPKLAAALAHLDAAQHEKLVEIFGRTTPRKVGAPTNSIWELIVGASKQTSDTDAIDTLRNIGLDKAAQVNNGARTAVERELLTAAQAQTVLDACERIGR